MLKKYFTMFIVLLCCCHEPLFSQCISSGARSGSITTNNTSVGAVAWTSCGNACLSDDARATAGAILIGDKTNYLMITDFGFSLPSLIPVCGITVELEGSATGLLQVVDDNSIRLVKSGAIVGTNKAGAANWPNSDAIRTYGANNDLWGTTWTYSDINASDFGVAISVNLTSLSALPTARVDHVRITVHYDITTLPIELVEFKGKRTNINSVELSWISNSESNNDFFNVERSLNGYNWESIATVKGAGNSHDILYYDFTDPTPHNDLCYYRLKQTNFDNTYKYSDIINIAALDRSENAISVYPNPFSDVIHIDVNPNISKELEVEIIEAETKKVVMDKQILTSTETSINVQELDKGLYIIKVRDERAVNKHFKFLKMN